MKNCMHVYVYAHFYTQDLYRTTWDLSVIKILSINISKWLCQMHSFLFVSFFLFLFYFFHRLFFMLFSCPSGVTQRVVCDVPWSIAPVRNVISLPPQQVSKYYDSQRSAKEKPQKSETPFKRKQSLFGQLVFVVRIFLPSHNPLRLLWLWCASLKEEEGRGGSSDGFNYLSALNVKSLVSPPPSSTLQVLYFAHMILSHSQPSLFFFPHL